MQKVGVGETAINVLGICASNPGVARSVRCEPIERRVSVNSGFIRRNDFESKSAFPSGRLKH